MGPQKKAEGKSKRREESGERRAEREKEAEAVELLIWTGSESISLMFGKYYYLLTL